MLDLVVGWASLMHQFLDICSSFAKYPRLFGGISMVFGGIHRPLLRNICGCFAEDIGLFYEIYMGLLQNIRIIMAVLRNVHGAFAAFRRG